MATGMGSGGRTIGAPEEMMMLTNEQIAAFGIVTREAKGDELTHEELDRNLLTMIDVAIFTEVYSNSVLEYTAIRGAETLDMAIGSVSIDSMYGYGAVKLADDLVGKTLTWDNGYGTIYTLSGENGGYLTVSESEIDGSDGITVNSGDQYLVLAFAGTDATSATVTVQTDNSEEGQ